MDLTKKLLKSKDIPTFISELSIDDLVSILEYASQKYFEDEQVISDELFDALKDTLVNLDPKNKFLKKIGSVSFKETQTHEKVKLPYHMGSMDKVKYNEEDKLNKWLDKYTNKKVLSDKLDGISCLLQCKKTKYQLFTRGDGETGRDITHLIEYFNIPKNIPNISIRGEIIMSKKNFKKYSDKFENSRNLVGGQVNSKKSLKPKIMKDIEYVVYEIVNSKLNPSDQMKYLEELGFKVVDYKIKGNLNINYLEELFQDRKKNSEYDIDGIIITDNDTHEAIKEGNPPFSIAYKGQTETKDVKVLNVVWSASKDGKLNPVIHIEPVILSGVTISKLTAFNGQFIYDNKIGKDAIIKITRSNDVIPHILEVIKKAKESQMPDEDYEWGESGVSIYVKNKDTNQDVIIKRLLRFFQTLGVDNLSEATVLKLVNNGYDTIIKIIKMEKKDFLSMDGFQNTLATKLYTNLQNALATVNTLTLMNATNIFGAGFGERKIKKILDVYPNIVDLYDDEDEEEWKQKIIAIDGFNVKTAELFLLELPHFIKLYKKINKLVKVKEYKKVKTGNRFENDHIVFTEFRNKEWKDIIEKEGGKVTDGISGKTTLLVYADGKTDSVKYKKAIEKNIQVMSQSEFDKMINS